jgi:AcrR family transcriptional regulator
MPVRLDKQRARSADDKALRRGAIVEATRRAIARTAVGDLTVAEVARAAGLAKGSLLRYFRSREELLIAAFEAELVDYFDYLDRALGRGGALGPRRLARVIVQGLAERPVFLQLATVLHTALGGTVSLEVALRFKLTMLERIGALGGRLEQRMRGLRPGQGARISLRVYALVNGFWQLCDHPPIVLEAIEKAGLDALRIDFADELEDVLVALLRGMEANHAQDQRD